MIPKNWVHPQERSARWHVSDAIRKGILVRPLTCSACGINSYIEGHHADYSKALEVEWLCKRCHKAADKRDHPKNCYRLRCKAARYRKVQKYYKEVIGGWARHFAAKKAAEVRWEKERKAS